MSTRAALIVLSVAGALSACHTAPSKDRPVIPAEPSSPPAEIPPVTTDNNVAPPTSEETKTAPAEVPSCACADNTPKPAFKRKPKPVVRAPAPEPPAAAPTAPPAPGEAGVKLVERSTASILGRKVRGQDGEDLGRVVDILADEQGRVQIAVIEFGGFLGVGNRRIAVDWSLLKFAPGDADAPVILNASKSKLQATPEYKGTARPLALMAPAASAALPPTAPK